MNSHRKAAASLVVPAKDIVPDRGSQQWMVGRDQVPSVPACEFLEWDSTFFGCRIARITANRITADQVSAIIDWCAAERIDCLYFLADPTDLFTIRLAEDNGFRCVDIRVTFEMRVERHAVSEQYEAGMLRQARPADVPELQAIARTGFRQARFFFDPGFSTRKAEALYETWIEKSCEGYADAVFVADDSGEAVGFITCHLHGDRSGQIGLLGVRPDRQGRGVGRGLIRAALGWFRGRDVNVIRVVTQGRNRGALRLYELSGFMIDKIEVWYHRWFTTTGEGAGVRERSR